MTDNQLKEIYRTACYGKGFEPNDGQFKVWKQTLGWCEEADLAQALVWYFQENTSFPMPAELKPLSERARRGRTAKTTGPKDEVRWRCPDCYVTMTGSIDPSDDRPRICRGLPRNRPQCDPQGNPIPCGAVMDEIERTRAA